MIRTLRYKRSALHDWVLVVRTLRQARWARGANPRHTLGPSCSVRLQAAPHSVGPTVFLGSPANPHTVLVPPAVCGSRPLLTVWDLRFSKAHGQPATHSLSHLEYAAPGRFSQAGTRGFPGLTATRNVHLDPPVMCGSWPLLAAWDPRCSWAHHQPTFCLNLAKGSRNENVRSGTTHPRDGSV